MHPRGTMMLEFHPDEVRRKFHQQLQLTTEAVTHTYHALINFSTTELAPLQTHSFPIVLENKEPFDPILSRDKALTWLFKKAFEEFITGIGESLIEAHRYAKMYELSNKTREREWILLEHEINSKLEQIDSRPHTIGLPILIQEIELIFGVQLRFKKEIISINQVRNCLVHRNGKVSQKDANNPEKNALVLNYIDLVFYREKDGQMVEITWEQKEAGFETKGLTWQVLGKEMVFGFGEKVVLDQNIFNAVAYTCLQFVEKLQESLPHPQAPF